MTRDDLDQLDLWSGFPAEHRLASCIEAALSGPHFKLRCSELATHLGYSRPEVVKQWLSHDVIIPLRHLPAISRFLGIHLSVLATFWLATYAADDDEADEISQSISPRITDAEFELIETARALYQGQADDLLDP